MKLGFVLAPPQTALCMKSLVIWRVEVFGSNPSNRPDGEDRGEHLLPPLPDAVTGRGAPGLMTTSGCSGGQPLVYRRNEVMKAT